MTETKLRAAILTRVSTEEQAAEGKTSLEEQARLCQQFIASRGWAFTGEIYEDVMSGTTPVKHRPSVLRIFRDAEAGELDVVVVLNLTRLSRKLSISEEIDTTLAQFGVGLASAQESMIDTSTPAGRLFFQTLCAFAEFERESILIKTVGGQRAAARNGRLPGGEPPYGWKRLRKTRGEGDGSIVPNETEREVLRLGYELLVKRRMTCYQIVDWFNDAGIKPRRAKQWNAETVRNIWRNSTLTTGKLWWGVPKGQGDLRQRHSKTKLDPRGNPVWGEPIEIDLGHPVFTAAEHRAILRALNRRTTGATPNAPKSRMLSGRVYTAEGHHMYSVNTPKEEWVGYYRCTKRRQSAGADRCQCPQFRALPLEELVWAEVVRLLSDPERLQAAARAYLALPEEGSDQEADRQALEGVKASVARLERALLKSERGILMADSVNDERRQQALAAQLKTELLAAQQRLAGYEALVSSDEARGQALQDVAALAERARGRLHTMTETERAEVVEILQVSVVTSGAVVGGAPEMVAISGVVDPRLWAPNAGSEASPEDATPAYPESQSQLGVAS